MEHKTSFELSQKPFWLVCWMIDVTHLVMKIDVKAEHVHRGSAFKASTARLAQSAERKALNLVVVGSSPTVGAF